MKKLLIAMTAAAIGTCAWADGEQTLLSESFTGWTLTDNTWWSYSAEAADGELTVTNTAAENAEAEYKLALNTGSKVLTGSFTSDDQPKAIGTDGLYFKSTVTFKDPSDTLPELKDSDKFALVVLDNVESIEEGYTATPATNLWVIAKYGESGQRAYQLDVEVDPTWLAVEHEIVVKAYENVMASGYAACAGFIVMVDETVCKVMQSCALEGSVINYAKSCSYLKWNDSLDANGTGDLGYLGYPLTAINPKYQKRYCDPEKYNTSVLILSNVPGNGTLKSVDFQGQGVIDDVELTADGTGLDFGTDSLAIAVTADSGVTLKNCADGTLYYSGTLAEITFELDDGYKLKGVSTNAVEGVDGVYSLTIDPTQYTTDGFKVEAFLPVVSVVVGEETLEYGSLSEAISKVAANAELKLTDAITLTAAIVVDKNITINLNGKKLSAALSGTFTSMFKVNGNLTLTITDTANGVLEVTGGDRALASSNRGVATVAINKGTIDAACAVGTGGNTINYDITGGKFLKEANATIAPATGYAATDDGKGYWVVAVASTSDYPESDKFVGSDTELTDVQKKAVEATFEAIAGEAADADAAVTNYFTTVYGENAKVPVATITGAKNVGISVANNLPLMTSENAEFVAEAVAADDGNVAAFEFTLKDGNTDDAETLLLSAQTAIQKLIKVCSDLKNNSWTAPTIGTDVDATVTDGKIKVQLKSGKANFMKIQATAE